MEKGIRRNDGMPPMDSLRSAMGAPEVEDTRRMQVGGFGGPPVFPEDESPDQDRYRQFDAEDESGNDDEDYEFEDEEEEDEDYPRPPSLRQPGGAFLEDPPVFPGGPPISVVNSWKKQFESEGHTVNASFDIGGVDFIWRSMNRVEYRSIMALPNIDPLQREEVICDLCVLYPYDYSFDGMASQKAGIPAVLSEEIMKESAFKKPEKPRRL